MRRNQLKLK